jgi:predicted ATPase
VISYVKRLSATGLFGRFNIEQDFRPGVNILHGRNGTGKTTLLNILANALNADFERFAFLDFGSIEIEFDDGSVVRLSATSGIITVTTLDDVITIDVAEIRKQTREHERQEESEAEPSRPRTPRARPPVRSEPILGAAYFPAFRTMLEAWASDSSPSYLIHTRRSDDYARATSRVRELFGPFAPAVSYPSLPQIERDLSEEAFNAWAQVSSVDREQLSAAFLRIFGSLAATSEAPSQNAEQLLSEIGRLSRDIETTPFRDDSRPTASVYGELRKMLRSMRVDQLAEDLAVRVLLVYRESFAELLAARTRSYAEINRYLSSVNEFLEGKEMIVNASRPMYRRRAVGIRFANERSDHPLRVLSSGERQILTLIYSATHMNKQSVVLIDEPELSLHVAWQRPLLRRMMEQLGSRQIIACTHSPVIGADFEDRLVELNLQPTNRPHPSGEEPLAHDQGALFI